jgi:hypothetical protein
VFWLNHETCTWFSGQRYHGRRKPAFRSLLQGMLFGETSKNVPIPLQSRKDTVRDFRGLLKFLLGRESCLFHL